MTMNRDLSKTVGFKIYVQDSILFLYISNNAGKVKSMRKISPTDNIYNSIKKSRNQARGLHKKNHKMLSDVDEGPNKWRCHVHGLGDYRVWPNSFILSKLIYRTKEISIQNSTKFLWNLKYRF